MKKILSIACASLMVLGIATTAFAATNPAAKITGMAQSLSVGYSGDPYLGDISPQDERVEYIDLTDAMFAWDDNYVPVATPTALTTSQIRNAKLTVRATSNKVLEDVSINASKSRIEVKFLDELVDTKEIDFDFDVILSVEGRRQSNYAMNFSGTFANPVFEVYAGTEREDISRGEVAEAQEYIKSIVFDAGSGVFVNTKMMKDSRSYATATLTPDKADEAVFAEYKAIRDVINLKTSGIPSSATVTLGAEYKGYYVFCKKGNYLGRGDASLLLTDKYYLATEMVADFVNDKSANEDTSSNTEPKPVEGVKPPVSSSTEGNHPENVNHNPNTGR